MKREQTDFLALVRACADCGRRTDGTFTRPVAMKVDDEGWEIEFELICGDCWRSDTGSYYR